MDLKLIFLELTLFFWITNSNCQDCGLKQKEQGRRYSYYKIHTELNDSTHVIRTIQEIRFKNHTDIPLDNLYFYLYLNSFKNEKSSFLKGANEIFGNPYKDRSDLEWSDLKILKLSVVQNKHSADVLNHSQAVFFDDGNKDDESVLEVCLPTLFLPDDTIILKLEWEARIPKVIARAGYSQDFYLFCHWFPQLGVLEKNTANQWYWNCHQFFRSTEFYGEFSDYDIWIKCNKDFKLCSSGEFIDEIRVGNNLIKHYRAEKLIDFAWAIHKNCYIREWKWKNIQIRLMLPNDYREQEERFVATINFGLQYMSTHLAYYPYNTLSIVCPPLHALRTGLMEYPSLITTGSIFGMPSFIHNAESLIMHEFVHQYFMAVLANNEKEEPWMDEGFATYYEDRIIDALFGDHQSLIHFMGFKMDNKQLTRMEYTGMNNPSEGIIARPAWCFTEETRKAMIYSKTATIFHSLERIIGQVNMDTIMSRYYQCYKFTHPSGKEFMQFVQNQLYQLVDSSKAFSSYKFVKFGIYNEGFMDYTISEVKDSAISDSMHHYSIVVQNKGIWNYPLSVKMIFEDGSNAVEFLNGNISQEVIEVKSTKVLTKLHLDPEQLLLTDLNLNNNTYSIHLSDYASLGFSYKLQYWLQNITHFISFLI
ncbi:MAG: M1 family metallopeptidase [Saprospiraceae bacterium]|nr:M1 family metallopeptidase [Saprospiraceae bacterium]